MLILFYGLAFSYLNKETKGKLTAMFIVSVLLTLMRPYMLLFLLLACFSGSAEAVRADGSFPLPWWLSREWCMC